MARNYYDFKDLVVLSSSNQWTCKSLKGMNHTKANDASVIFQRITSLLVSQATSKVRKCLLVKYMAQIHISLTETTSICCFQIYLIQLYLIKMLFDSQVKLFCHIFDSVVFDKCCLTVIGASYYARRSSRARSTRGQENEAWALYKKFHPRSPEVVLQLKCYSFDL